MLQIAEFIADAEESGYHGDNAEAKACQDIVLKAISESSLSRNVTIKGGVVMRSISNNSRRATLDIDMDFIRYSLSDESIKAFVDKLNCLDGIHIRISSEIEELRQQDYRGKRVYVEITDDTGDSISSKIDLGVHANLDIEQDEYCFDIACFDDGASLLINSREQMYCEKLKSLLKFGPFSTRSKDLYDMCFLEEKMDKEKLLHYMNMIIFSDSKMRENSIDDIRKRVHETFSNKSYIRKLGTSNRNWLNMPPSDAMKRIENYLRDL